MVQKKNLKKGWANKLFKAVNKVHLPVWLILLLIVVLVLRIPSFFEPFSYGDEMIYLTLGEAIRQGKVLYLEIHDNKPPLLYILAAVAGNVFWFRVILAFWSFVTVVVFWKLTQVLFPRKPRAQQVATAVFALLTTIPLFEGQIANSEVFMVGPTVLAILILLTKGLKPIILFAAGLLFSVATLFKVPAVFDLPVIVFYWLITEAVKLKKSVKKKLVEIGIRSIFLLAGFILPIIIISIWYLIRGGFQEYLVAAFLQNVGYLSSWRPEAVVDPFLVRNGPLLARGVIILVGITILFFVRKRLSKAFLLASLWLLFSLFAATLSERPYPHYLIQAVPAISILVSILVTDKTLQQSLAIIPLFLAVITPVYYKFWYYPTVSYYSRFLQFASGQISKSEYFDKFDGDVNRNYAIANFIRNTTEPTDEIFVWGNSSPIYALSKRLPPIKYVANYHIRDFSSQEDVADALNEDQPIYIVLLPNSPQFPELNQLLKNNYVQVSEYDGAQIWRVIKPQLRLLLNRLLSTIVQVR